MNAQRPQTCIEGGLFYSNTLTRKFIKYTRFQTEMDAVFKRISKAGRKMTEDKPQT